ncbi:MAG TPA: hypothetical protein VMB49_17290 [Acidobacteriaceae bacterium]|nr:hypothetical protein [Acidobacteriaceae bacterium]
MPEQKASSVTPTGQAIDARGRIAGIVIGGLLVVLLLGGFVM